MGQPHESGTYELGDIMNHKKNDPRENPPSSLGKPPKSDFEAHDVGYNVAKTMP